MQNSVRRDSECAGTGELEHLASLSLFKVYVRHARVQDANFLLVGVIDPAPSAFTNNGSNVASPADAAETRVSGILHRDSSSTNLVHTIHEDDQVSSVGDSSASRGQGT